MKIYEGAITKSGYSVTLREDGGEPHLLNPRLDLLDFKADGFEWGDGGPGASQLALALAANVLDNGDRAKRVYRDLKSSVITCLPRDEGWTLTEDALRAELNRAREWVPIR